MKTCECGGDLLRHGSIRYQSGSVSYRYICRGCRKTITAPITDDIITGKLHHNTTGRPMLNDRRHTA